MNYRQEWHQTGPVSVLIEWDTDIHGQCPRVLCTLTKDRRNDEVWVMYTPDHRMFQLAYEPECDIDGAQKLAEDVLVNECGED